MTTTGARGSGRPNVLLVHWHDLGRHLGCYGHPTVDSPNLDTFARESVRFARAFATSPGCTPARSAVFTGRYPHTNGLLGLAHRGWTYKPGERTLPMLLGDHGYDTALIGLQHEADDPGSVGFAEVSQVDGVQHADAVADLAVRWLHGRGAQTAPFLATVGFFEVHRPYPAERYAPADPDAVDVPAYLPDNPSTRADLAAFHGAIRVADAAVGRILAALDDSGLRDDTLVVFTTDHGIAFPGAKATLYDAGLGVALMVRPPASWGVAPGVCDDLVSHLDLLPTLLAACGAPLPDNLQGASLLRAAGDGFGSARTELYAEKTYHAVYDPMRCIRTTDSKYIRNFEPGYRLVLPTDIENSPTRAGMGEEHTRPRPVEELYDLRRDPREQHNLVGDPGYAEVHADLAARLERWQRETDDPLLSVTRARALR